MTLSDKVKTGVSSGAIAIALWLGTQAVTAWRAKTEHDRKLEQTVTEMQVTLNVMLKAGDEQKADVKKLTENVQRILGRLEARP